MHRQKRVLRLADWKGRRKMAWTEVNFGKWADKGKTLPQIVFSDPDWFFWAVEKQTFFGPLAAEAADIARKAKRIKIPGAAPGEKKVRYFIHPSVDKFAGAEVVPSDRPPHVGSSGTRESQFFDLSMPRRIAPYDKHGGKLLVRAVKYQIFGSGSVRLTKERCENFFNDPANFG
jgi:hypothetical protein